LAPRTRRTPSRSIRSDDENWLLRAIPAAEHERLSPDLEDIELPLREILYETGGPIDYVYLPRTCVISMVTEMANGAVVEFATVGNEGLVGFPAFLGTERSSHKVMCQIPGAAARMSVRDFRRHVGAAGTLRMLMQRYTVALFAQIAQHAACNRVHTVERRLAKWLLLCHDRVTSDEFPLTQEFLAQMLGVRRASVNQVVSRLRKDGAITYRRGVISVVDRKRLEAESCECYFAMRDEISRLVESESPRA
jgi:CRP-like cAMP-binding protein